MHSRFQKKSGGMPPDPPSDSGPSGRRLLITLIGPLFGKTHPPIENPAYGPEMYVINKKRPEFMTSIYSRYCDVVDESEQVCADRYTVRLLTTKLLNRFENTVLVSKASNKEGTVLHPIDIDQLFKMG